MQKTTGAEYIAQIVNTYGITHVFYVEAILRRTLVNMEKLGIRRVLAHSEKAAAYMADGYARAGMKPGLCMAQSVGAANLAAGLQDASLAHSPVVAFTGRKPPIFQYRNSYQEILHNRMFDPVTKYNAEVSTVEQLPYLLAQSFREATSGSPGPVHLDFLGYEGNLTDQAEGELRNFEEPLYSCVPPRRLIPDPRDIERSVGKIQEAERPVLVLGRGAVVSGAGEEIRCLAERLGIPVVLSPDGKGLIPDDHFLCAGVVGIYGCSCANTLVAEADLVFFIGCGTGDQSTKNWTLPSADTNVIQLDIEPKELGRNYPGAIGVLGDARTAIARLNEAIDTPISGSTTASERPWVRRAQQLVQEYQAKIEPFCSSGAVPIRPEFLCREITRALPGDAVVVADTGYSAIWAGNLINITRPNQRFIRAAGSLGWAFPAALGAKCALPERPVLCFCGDGAFWNHLSEVETAVRWGINTVTVINNNSVLGQCQPGIRGAYGGEQGREQELYRFRDTDFSRIAEDLGAVGIRVEKPEELGEALHKAFNARRPVVVDVITDPDAHPRL